MNYKFKTKPYEHQLKALEKSWEKSYFAYFMEMGTGKSKVLLDNIAMLYDQGKIDGALIVAPKGVIGTWSQQEIPTHFPDHIEKMSVLWQANITKGQSKKLGNLSFNLKLLLYLINSFLNSDKSQKSTLLTFSLSYFEPELTRIRPQELSIISNIINQIFFIMVAQIYFQNQKLH